MTFETDLDDLFNKAIDVKDTIWYSKYETLRDAIMHLYNKYKYQ